MHCSTIQSSRGLPHFNRSKFKHYKCTTTTYHISKLYSPAAMILSTACSILLGVRLLTWFSSFSLSSDALGFITGEFNSLPSSLSLFLPSDPATALSVSAAFHRLLLTGLASSLVWIGLGLRLFRCCWYVKLDELWFQKKAVVIFTPFFERPKLISKGYSMQTISSNVSNAIYLCLVNLFQEMNANNICQPTRNNYHKLTTASTWNILLQMKKSNVKYLSWHHQSTSNAFSIW